MARFPVNCISLSVAASLLVFGAGRVAAHEDHDGDDQQSSNTRLVGSGVARVQPGPFKSLFNRTQSTPIWLSTPLSPLLATPNSSV